MNTITKQYQLFLALLGLIFITACGSLATSPALDAPIIDTEAIAQEVLTQIELPMSQTEELSPTITEETAVANAFQSGLVDLYQRANPAVVFIVVPPLGSGSGFVFNDQGYIVTNNHVVDGGSRFEVVFADGSRQEAELVGQNVDSDLAVIKVDSLPGDAEPLPLADVESIQVGQFVVAIGNPFGEQGSMSLGIISGLGRSLPSRRGLTGGNSYSLPEIIQTDAPINPGNSGGPLLNLNGEVVGVNSAIASTSGTGSGVGFSIPVSAVRRIAPSLIEAGAYSFPYMGAGFDDEVSLNEKEIYGLTQTQGAYVLNVTAGSPADEAGLAAADPDNGRGGDLVIEIDGQPINNFSDLNSYLVFNTSVGQTIDITIFRDGDEIVLPLTLGERP